MKQRGGCLWLLVGLFLAVVAGGLAFAAMLKATSAEPAGKAEPMAPVVIVARDVPPRTQIIAEDLITKEMPLSAIPANAVRDQEAAIGKVTTAQLIAGEMLLERRIAEPGQPGPQVSFDIEPGKVVMAFPTDDLMSQSAILQPGDIVDILYSTRVKFTKAQTEDSGGETETDMVTFWALQKVSITAVVLPAAARSEENRGRSQAGPLSILLALDPQDALLLKHLKDTDSIVDIVLRAREDDAEYETKPVSPLYLKEKYDLTPSRQP
ncbi:MAG: Flp pilus assembly protein CpaB [Anaerolineae bacterium]